jgi:hypothetical protein
MGEAIKAELKQLTHYQTFIVLDSGESIPNGYQKIPNHMVFDVKYDLIHKARIGRRKTYIQELYSHCKNWAFLRRIVWTFLLCM